MAELHLRCFHCGSSTDGKLKCIIRCSRGHHFIVDDDCLDKFIESAKKHTLQNVCGNSRKHKQHFDRIPTNKADKLLTFCTCLNPGCSSKMNLMSKTLDVKSLDLENIVEGKVSTSMTLKPKKTKKRKQRKKKGKTHLSEDFEELDNCTNLCTGLMSDGRRCRREITDETRGLCSRHSKETIRSEGIQHKLQQSSSKRDTLSINNSSTSFRDSTEENTLFLGIGTKSFKTKCKSGVEVSAERGSEVTSERGAEVSSERGAEVSSEKGVEVFSEVSSEVTSEVSAERGVDVSSERGSDVSSEKGVDVSSERGAEVSSKLSNKIDNQSFGGPNLVSNLLTPMAFENPEFSLFSFREAVGKKSLELNFLELLSAQNLLEYVPVLERKLILDINALCLLNDNDLQDICISNTEHRRRFMDLIERYKTPPQKQIMLNETAFLCPLTNRIFENPVVASDGFTYSKKAFEQYILDKHNEGHTTGKPVVSPLNGEVLQSFVTVPNKYVMNLLFLWNK